MDESLREQLTARRLALGLTQSQAGRESRPAIAQDTISEIETGASNPHLGTLERYCRDALGCRLAIVDL